MITQNKIDAVPRIARLELTWECLDASACRWVCHYDLVNPLGEVDCRGTFDIKPQKRPKSFRMVWLDKDNCQRIPMGRTMVTGCRPGTHMWPDGTLYIPFRDGAHMGWDAERLGLRCFVIAGDEIREIIKTS